MPAYITYAQQWSRSPRSFPPTVPGTAQNSSVPSILSTWLSLDLHPFQPGSPLMRLSVIKVVALLLASAKSWFPPLTPWLTYFCSYANHAFVPVGRNSNYHSGATWRMKKNWTYRRYELQVISIKPSLISSLLKNHVKLQETAKHRCYHISK